MMPYSALKTTMRNWPNGWPLALKMSDVAPIREAASVKKFSLSKTKKETRISATENPQTAISPFEKSPDTDFIVVPPKKQAPAYTSSKT